MRAFFAMIFFLASSIGLALGSMAGALYGVHSMVVAGAVQVDYDKLAESDLMHLPLKQLAEFPINYRG